MIRSLHLASENIAAKNYFDQSIQTKKGQIRKNWK